MREKGEKKRAAVKCMMGLSNMTDVHVCVCGIWMSFMLTLLQDQFYLEFNTGLVERVERTEIHHGGSTECIW